MNYEDLLAKKKLGILFHVTLYTLFGGIFLFEINVIMYSYECDRSKISRKYIKMINSKNEKKSEKDGSRDWLCNYYTPQIRLYRGNSVDRRTG